MRNNTLSVKYFLFFGLALLTFFSQNHFSQSVTVKIKVLDNHQILVEGKFIDESASMQDWEFTENYADVTNLASRIEKFELIDSNGEKIALNAKNSGYFTTEKKPILWKYRINLLPNGKMTDAAHVSWLTKDYGLLFLADILPKFNSQNVLVINFELPENWVVKSLESKSVEGFKVANYANSVFAIGKNLREKSAQFDGFKINLAINGEWQFSDVEAIEMAESILSEYRKTFKEMPSSAAQIFLLPFPQNNSNYERWRAETRGANSVIISGANPYKSQAIQRLHEQLRHELLHLWIPNGLNLSGNYDWFYEGFAVYFALRTGVELNQIRFDDFLNTLSRAYQMEQMMSESLRISLVNASQNRWAGYGNYIYSKGLVVAFLCERALLSENKGKSNLKEVFRTIYAKHKESNRISDGNSAIINILKSYPALRSIVENYIEGTTKIDWENNLKNFGIEQKQTDFGFQLQVISKPTGRQKDLLDKLGYNQWRKIAEQKK